VGRARAKIEPSCADLDKKKKKLELKNSFQSGYEMFDQKHCDQPVIIYEAGSRSRIGFCRSMVGMASNIIRSWELIKQLFIRDYLAAYKKTFLGITWIAISPVLGIISWLFMNAAGILRPGETNVPYPVYLLLGTTIWGLFMGFYQSAAATLSVGQSFILQVNYPHEVLLVKQALEQVANFCMALVLNLLILLLFGICPSWKICLLPLVVLPLFFLGAGLGLIISVTGVVATEVRRACDMGLGFMIFLTPVIYTTSAANPMFRPFFQWNPLTHLINAARDTILYGRIPDPHAFAWSSLFTLIFFVVACRLFYVSEQRVIEKLF
jgi:lipopolysaccharide transport system permease protein